MDSIEHFDKCLGWALGATSYVLPKDQRHPLGGQLLDAVAKRDSEDWLLAITTDHGGGVAMGLIAFVLVVDQPGIHDAFRFHPFFSCFILFYLCTDCTVDSQN
jgi:hypothetical protein